MNAPLFTASDTILKDKDSTLLNILSCFKLSPLPMTYAVNYHRSMGPVYRSCLFPRSAGPTHCFGCLESPAMSRNVPGVGRSGFPLNDALYIINQL